MKPTPAEILNGIPLKERAKMPPTADSGMAVKIKKACLTDENVKYSSTKISSNAMGNAILSRARASSRFLNVPP